MQILPPLLPPLPSRLKTVAPNVLRFAAIAYTTFTIGCQATTSATTSAVEQNTSARAHPPKRPETSQSIQTTSLTISAASSLQNALKDIKKAFEQQHPDIDILYNWGGSGTLQRQIEQGAPIDIFFSASSAQVEALTQQGKLKASVDSVLTSQLVLIVPKDSTFTGFADIANLESSQPVAVGEFQSVPAGQYAKETLDYFKLLPQLSSQLVFFNNVRGVLAAVENGHAAAGLVYLSDADSSNRVKIAAIAPPTAHMPIHYPIAILQRSEHPQAAQKYIDFLSSPIATEIFERYRFSPHHDVDSP